MRTPHKSMLGGDTPLVHTPRRTPLADAEQRSSTPITPFETIEAQKENVQPRIRGRSAHALSTTLGMQHKERQEMLAAQRAEHERAITSEANQESDDPLEAWCAYVKWTIDQYPSGQSAESGLVCLLERATRTFRDSDQYRNDSRYLRLWILYAQNVECPRDVYQFLLANELGTKLAALYEELALVMEGQGEFNGADDVYKLGIARRVSPLERIKRRYAEFQQRVVAAAEDAGGQPSYTKALSDAMARAGRSVLGVKSGDKSAPSNVVRGLGGTAQPLSSAAPHNARTMRVYRDQDENVAPDAAAPAPRWAQLGSAQQRQQENQAPRRGLHPMSSALTPQTQRRMLEVFPDSDEEQESTPRTPRTQDGDVFHRSSQPASETDKLRRNPFLHWEQERLAAKDRPKEQPHQAEPPQQAEPPRPRASEQEKRHHHHHHAHRSRSARPEKARAPASSTHPERHMAPLQRMYPGVDVAAALQHKARTISAEHERCIDEVFAEQLGVSHGADPWSYLDEYTGRWLPEPEAEPEAEPEPEPEAPMRPAPSDATDKVSAPSGRQHRAPSPTLVTRAAMAEVDNMFNGEDESSEEDSSEDESDESEPVVMHTPVASRSAPADENGVEATPVHDENVGIQPTPARSSARVPFGVCTPRTPLAAREPPVAPLEVHQDEEEEEDEEQLPPLDEEPIREHFQPLTPITEKTEVTRRTDSTRSSDAVRTPTVARTPPAERRQRTVDERHAEGAETEPAPVVRPPPHGGLLRDPAELGLPSPCSPVDPDVLGALLRNLATPLSHTGCFLDLQSVGGQGLLQAVRKHACKTRARRSSVAGGAQPWALHVEDMCVGIHHMLGEGGYGAVFLAEDLDGHVPLALGQASTPVEEDDIDEEERRRMLALKVESPANIWEFYLLEQLQHRLDASLRSSVVGVRRFTAYADESLLMLEYGATGTLLDLVNQAAAAGVASAAPAPAPGAGGSSGLDEVLAMFFVVELLRLLEGLHRADVIHGDLKIDNCLIRYDPLREGEAWESNYAADGSGGWHSKGVKLIDFGRAIDLRCYPAHQTFLSDWAPGAQDCIEMREARPWTYQTDYFGLAGIAYCLLYGRYIEVTSSVGAEGQKQYRIQQPLRRYWQVPLWTRLFDTLLNPRLASAHGTLPITEELGAVRREMEEWLAANSFRAGKVCVAPVYGVADQQNLKGLLKKVEIWALRA